MLVLVGKAVTSLAPYRTPELGRLVSPRHYSQLDQMVAEGWPWAADNDAFGGFDEPAFARMLDHLAGRGGCLFVTAPDRVGDAPGTLAAFERWGPEIRGRGFPVALVAQDGLEHLAVPWDGLDALFIGGAPSQQAGEWKCSPAAAALVAAARARGKWTHMGRVNTYRRMELAASFGCHSADGSGFARFTDRWLRPALARAAAGAQLPLVDLSINP